VSPRYLLVQLIEIYSVVVVVAVIVSWLRLPPSNPVVRFTRLLTEPALAPIRKIVPPAAGLDFSPWILLILLWVLRGMI
jgi:YggT family protein